MEKEGTPGEGKDGDGWNGLRYFPQMHPDLFPLSPRPSFICVPGFHEKLHQSLDRNDFHEDGFLIQMDQPFQIFLNHRRTVPDPTS